MGPARPRAPPRSARTGRRSRRKDRERKSERGPEDAGCAIAAPGCWIRRPRNSARSVAARPPGRGTATWARPPGPVAARRNDPDAWQRRELDRVSCPAARCRITRRNGRIRQRRCAVSGSAQARRPAALFLELTRLPALLLLLLGLAIIRFRHEVSSVRNSIHSTPNRAEPEHYCAGAPHGARPPRGIRAPAHRVAAGRLMRPAGSEGCALVLFLLGGVSRPGYRGIVLALQVLADLVLIDLRRRT